MKLKIIFLTISSTLLLLTLSALFLYYHPLCAWGYKTRYLPDFYFFDERCAWEWSSAGLMEDAYLPDVAPQDVAEKGKTLVLTYRGEPHLVYDVSEWKPGEDVVGFYLPKPFPRMDEERAPLLFFYPWHGEDSIDYKVDPEPLTVNGKIVGGILSPIESINILGDEEIDIEQIDLRTQGILTLTTQEFEPEYTIRRLRRFPDLEVVFMYLDRISYAYSDCFVWNEALHYKEKCWLSKWLYFRNLKRVTEIADLYLYIEGVRDAELWFLGNFTKLKGLWIKSDSLTDDGLAHLEKLSGLRTLYLYGTEVSEEGVAELGEVLPECKITSR